MTLLKFAQTTLKAEQELTKRKKEAALTIATRNLETTVAHFNLCFNYLELKVEDCEPTVIYYEKEPKPAFFYDGHEFCRLTPFFLLVQSLKRDKEPFTVHIDRDSIVKGRSQRTNNLAKWLLS